MRKIYLLISIFIILILAVGLISCVKPEEGTEEGDNFYYEDKPYSFAYTEGVADCRMELDGQGHCAIYKKYSYEKPVDPEDEKNVTSLSATNAIWVQYTDNGINFEGTYCFGKDGELHRTEGTSLDARETFDDAKKTGKTYSMSYNYVIDGMNGVLTFSIKPIIYDAGQCRVAFGYSINVPEFAKANGEYTIVNGRFVKLNFKFNEDFPTVGLQDYEILPITTGEGYATQIIAEKSGRENGHVEISISDTEKRYVQLKDDGTFYFVIASTTSSEEDLFTQGSYYGKSFIFKASEVTNGEGYSYEYKLSFNETGVATYECVNSSMSKNYRVTDDSDLSLLYYDIDEYNRLMGTHRDIGTSNNISFANNYIIYVDYNYSRYVFSGDTNIMIYRFEGYSHIKLKNDKGAVIAAKIYDDGKIEWIENDFRGIDLTDYSDDL